MLKHCPCCGSEVKPQPEVTGTDLRFLRAKLGFQGGRGRKISQEALGELLGISGRAVRNYEQGKRRVPPWVAREAKRLQQNAPLLKAAS